MVTGEGVILSELPLSITNANTPSLDMGYHLCVCENGRLFRASEDCAKASELNGLCASN